MPGFRQDGMPTDQPRTRFDLAERIRALASSVPLEVTEAFLERHPDWVARFGDRARTAGIEDARYHVLFLSAAIESGAPSAFAEYATWTARVLRTRGIEPGFLAENLVQVGDAVRARLGAHALLDACLDAGLQALRAVQTSAEAPAEPAPEDALGLTYRMYVQALLAGERRAALNVAREALRTGVPAMDLYVEVLQAAQYEIGRLWETNRITVAHEHAATAITQFVMAQIYDGLERSPLQRGNLVMTGIDGEYHNIGAMMVADMLETCGWNVRFLGTNLPARSIVDAVVEHEATWLGISVTMIFNIQAARRLIAEVRARCGPAVRVVVGGAAFRHGPDLWQEIGADGRGLDVRSTVALLCG